MDFKVPLRVIKSSMPDIMRQIIMDCLRQALLLNFSEQECLSLIKKGIEKNLDGKWQIIKGKHVVTAYDSSWFAYFIEI